PNMDSLVAMGASASFLYSVYLLTNNRAMNMYYFDGAAMIIALITLGKFLEARAKAKSTGAMEEIASLTPKVAKVLTKEGSIEERQIEDLKIGDIIVISPKERVPADSVVIEGESLADEAFLTGESAPVPKKKGLMIIAGSLNGNGALKARVLKTNEDSSLSRILSLIAEASAGKPKIARIADKVSAVFVPSIMTIALTVFISWLLIGESLDFALNMAISVLVISCPCALGLATPVAVMAGIGRAAKSAMLIKNAEVLETAAKTSVALFDKTGTLTSGKPKAIDFIKINSDYSDEELIAKAAALEEVTEHPLALAVREYAKEQNISAAKAKNVKAVFGRGVKGVIDEKAVLFGSENFMIAEKVDISPYHGELTRITKFGATPLLLAIDGNLAGIFHIEDVLKATSKKTISLLKNLNITPIILTGDNQFTANALARTLNIEQALGSLLPEDKEREVKRLQSAGNTVLMTGDGVNDAPALMAADVSVAMGAGTEVAAESSDVIFIKNNLINLINLINLSRAVIKTIKENLFWAFFYNILAIPVAAGCFYSSFGLKLSPMIAAAAMSCSSLFVVVNSLRLRNLKLLKGDENINLNSDDKGEALLKENTKNIIEEENLMETTLNIKGMMCEHCKAHVTKALSAIDGVSSVEVNLDAGEAKVTTIKEVTNDTFKKAIEDAGYELA
ncbi:MAG: heavy metal translocating P-type ATPase, partial [Selenomonadaceae bacterium]|nr:heavy metal translocating P-type ATPase [Selenomonadaceae bacterium]